MKALKITLFALVALILGVVGLYLATSTQKFGDQPATEFKQLGGDFTVETTQGAVSLSDLEGRIVVMYFGFLNCPDVCPNSMLTIKSALKKLPDAWQPNIQVLLISVDPGRDDVQALAAFAQHYDPNYLGATATPAVIDQITAQYAAYYSVEPADSPADYEVSHSSRYYVIGPDGQLADAMRHSTTANELAARIKQVHQQSTSG